MKALVLLACCPFAPAVQPPKTPDLFDGIHAYVSSDKMEYYAESWVGQPTTYTVQRHIQLDCKMLSERQTIQLVQKCLSPAQGWKWVREKDRTTEISIDIVHKTHKITKAGRTFYLEFTNISPGTADIYEVHWIPAKEAQQLRKSGVKFEEGRSCQCKAQSSENPGLCTI